jgi:phenylalanine-4-hydroxylase
MLQANCGYNENNIPQLQDIHNFLKDTTGFRLRPVGVSFVLSLNLSSD